MCEKGEGCFDCTLILLNMLQFVRITVIILQM